MKIRLEKVMQYLCQNITEEDQKYILILILLCMVTVVLKNTNKWLVGLQLGLGLSQVTNRFAYMQRVLEQVHTGCRYDFE